MDAEVANSLESGLDVIEVAFISVFVISEKKGGIFIRSDDIDLIVDCFREGSILQSLLLSTIKCQEVPILKYKNTITVGLTVMSTDNVIIICQAY